MNLALQSPGAEALSATGMVLRGVSPISGIPGYDVLSGFDGLEQQEQTMLFSPAQLLDLDNNSSVSPHSHTRRGHMSTHFGNFLYPVTAKKFPGQRQPLASEPEDHQLALKNQLMHLNAFKGGNTVLTAPTVQ